MGARDAVVGWGGAGGGAAVDGHLHAPYGGVGAGVEGEQDVGYGHGGVAQTFAGLWFVAEWGGDAVGGLQDRVVDGVGCAGEREVVEDVWAELAGGDASESADALVVAGSGAGDAVEAVSDACHVDAVEDEAAFAALRNGAHGGDPS